MISLPVTKYLLVVLVNSTNLICPRELVLIIRRLISLSRMFVPTLQNKILTPVIQNAIILQIIVILIMTQNKFIAVVILIVKIQNKTMIKDISKLNNLIDNMNLTDLDTKLLLHQVQDLNTLHQ